MGVCFRGVPIGGVRRDPSWGRKEFMAESSVQTGLEGVVAAHSSICYIDGQQGILSYRGYDIRDLAEHATYEEAAHLLLMGELPDRVELDAFRGELARRR